MSDQSSNNDKQGCPPASLLKQPCPPIRNVTHPLRYYEFTREEIKALEECDRESFYRRCLPFSGLLAGTTYALIKAGYLKRSPHFGVVPKLVLAAMAGHVAGRAVYVPACAKRLRALPRTSRLGELMRQYHAESTKCKK